MCSTAGRCQARRHTNTNPNFYINTPYSNHAARPISNTVLDRDTERSYTESYDRLILSPGIDFMWGQAKLAKTPVYPGLGNLYARAGARARARVELATAETLFAALAMEPCRARAARALGELT